MGLRMTWVGYYESSGAAHWFFHTDYSWFVLRALNELGNVCLTMVVAILLLPLTDIRFPPHGLSSKFVDEMNMPMITTAIIGLLIVFTIFEGGFLWGMRSAGLIPKRKRAIMVVRIVSQIISVIYVWKMLSLSLVIWDKSGQVRSWFANIYMRYL
jgi:hypothetical protein